MYRAYFSCSVSTQEPSSPLPSLSGCNLTSEYLSPGCIYRIVVGWQSFSVLVYLWLRRIETIFCKFAKIGHLIAWSRYCIDRLRDYTGHRLCEMSLPWRGCDEIRRRLGAELLAVDSMLRWRFNDEKRIAPVVSGYDNWFFLKDGNKKRFSNDHYVQG